MLTKYLKNIVIKNVLYLSKLLLDNIWSRWYYWTNMEFKKTYLCNNNTYHSFYTFLGRALKKHSLNKKIARYTIDYFVNWLFKILKIISIPEIEEEKHAYRSHSHSEYILRKNNINHYQDVVFESIKCGLFWPLKVRAMHNIIRKLQIA